MSIWKCKVCLYTYDESKGIPEEDINPGTSWEDIQEEWFCPDCGVKKNMFYQIPITEENSILLENVN